MSSRPPHTLIPLLMALAMALGIYPRAEAQEHFSRGLEQISFIPKGQWITGINVSYTQSDYSNYKFLIIENLSGDTYSFKLSPMLLYTFRDNLAAGGRVSYKRSRTRLNSADVVLDAETSYSPGNLFAINHSYSGTAVFRNYISLGHSMRFGFFNEIQLTLGGGQSKIINGEGVDLTGTWARNLSVDVGLTPGMIMFLNNYSAIEVSVGVLGFSYDHTHAVTDRIYVADYTGKSANFKVNLFSISFGAVFYL